MDVSASELSKVFEPVARKLSFAFQRECENLGLDTFYRHYIHRMQRSYLSIILVVQAFVSISHIIVLFVDNDVSVTFAHVLRISDCDSHLDCYWFQDDGFKNVIPDVFIYAFSLLAFTLFLLPAFNEDVSNTWRPFLCSFLAILSQVATGNFPNHLI